MDDDELFHALDQLEKGIVPPAFLDEDGNKVARRPEVQTLGPNRVQYLNNLIKQRGFKLFDADGEEVDHFGDDNTGYDDKTSNKDHLRDLIDTGFKVLKSDGKEITDDEIDALPDHMPTKRQLVRAQPQERPPQSDAPIPRSAAPSEDDELFAALDNLEKGIIPDLHGDALKKHLETLAVIDAQRYQEDQDRDSQVEREFRFKDKGWVERNVGMAIGAGGQRMMGGIARVAAAVTGNEEDVLVADQMHREGNITSAAREELRKKNNEGYLAKFVGMAAESVPAMLSAARLGAAGIVAIPAALQASESLTEAKDAGLKPADARKYALTQGFIEGAVTGIFQKFAPGVEGVILGKGVGGSTAKELAANLLKTYGSEWTEEQLIGLGQAAEKVASGVDPNALDADRLKQQFIDISGTTAVMTGGSHAARAAADSGAPAEQNPESVSKAVDWSKANPEAATALVKTGKLSRKDATTIGVERSSAADREAMLTAIERSLTTASGDAPLSEQQPTEAPQDILEQQYREGRVHGFDVAQVADAPAADAGPDGIRDVPLHSAAGAVNPKFATPANRATRRESVQVPGSEPLPPVERLQALRQELGRRPTKDEAARLLGVSREEAGFTLSKADEELTPRVPDEDLAALPMRDLHQRAAAAGLKGYAGSKREVLIQRIQKTQQPASSLPAQAGGTLADEFELEQQERIAQRAKGDRRATVVNLHPVTEMHEGKYANRRFVEIAMQRHSARSPVVYVEGDLRNLGGLNTNKGQTEADKHFKAMAAIVQEEIDALGADTGLTTKGGDEFGLTIVGKSKAEVDAALAKAEARIVHYVKVEGLDQLPHGKDLSGALGLRKGTGVAFASAQYDPRAHADASALIQAADRNLEKVKKESGNVDREQTGAAGPAASEGQARGTASGAGQAGAGSRRPGTEDGADSASGEQSADRRRQGRAGLGVERRSEPETKSDVASVPISTITLDPERFQYKIGYGKGGVTKSTFATKFNPDLSGTIDVWRDAADGKTYVVNGHHRFNLAIRDGYTGNLRVRYIDAPSASNARESGALYNIAEGRGTAIDAATFMRESGMTADDLRNRGISVTESIARDGAALAQLSDSLFSQVKTGALPVERGAVIGEIIKNNDAQEKLAKFIVNRKINPDALRALAEDFASAPEVKVSEETLFGSDVRADSIALHRAKIVAAIRERLSQEKRLFTFAAKNAEDLSEVGEIDKQAAGERGDSAGQQVYLFDKYRQNVLAPLLNEAAETAYRGASVKKAVDGVYSQVVERLTQPASAGIETETNLLGENVVSEESKARLGRQSEQGAMFDAELTADEASARKFAEQHRAEGGRELFDDSDELASHLDHESSIEQGTGDTISSQEIIARASRSFGVPVKSGYVSKAKAMGIYNQFERIVRLRGTQSANLYVAAHEIAHHIDNTEGLTGWSGFSGGNGALSAKANNELRPLDYDQTKRRPHEGFSEYIARLLDGENVAAKAPTFAAEFEQFLGSHPALKRKLDAFASDVKQWRTASAMARAEASTSQTGITDFRTTPEKARDFGRKVESKLLDRNAIARTFVADIDAERARQGLRKLADNQNPAKVMEAIGTSAHATATHALRFGVFNPITGKRYEGVRGMAEIMAPFDEAQWKEITQFARARHSLDWIADGRNPGIAEADARALIQKFEGNTAYVKAADEWVKYSKALLDVLVDAGVITSDMRKSIDKYTHYVPLQRAFDVSELVEGKVAGTSNPLKRASHAGSGRQVIDPLTASIKQTYDVYRTATETVVYRKYVEAAKGVSGVGNWISEVKLPRHPAHVGLEEIKKQLEAGGVEVADDADLTALLTFWKVGKPGVSDNVIPVVIDGKARWFQVHPDLKHVVSHLNKPANELLGPMLEGTLRPFTELKRFGAVEARVGFFGGSNPIRDIATGIIQTKGNPFQFALRTIGNMLLVGKSDDVAQLYRRSGAASSHFYGGNLEKVRAQVSDLVNDAKKREKHNIVLSGAELIGRMLRSPIQSIKALAEHFEQAPRLAEFEGQLNAKGITRNDLAAGRDVSMDELLQPTLAAKQVTTNFEQAGSILQRLNRVNAFTNAAVQGYVQPLQRFNENPSRFSLRGAAALTVPTLLLWLINKDKDWYKELEPWQRFGFWHIDLGDGRPVKIPRPFEIGTVFSALPEAIFESAAQRDPKRMQQFAEQVLPTKMSWIDLLPDALQPALEAAFNYDVFRRKKIVGAHLENRKPEDQFNDYNTAASQYIGRAFGMSPAMIDHVVGSYTGGLATDILRIPEEGPARALALRRFSSNVARGESINEFYERARQLEQEYTSAGGADGARPELKAKKLRFDHIQSLMSAVNDHAKSISDKTARAELQRFNVGLSRLALGKEPLKEYPSLFTARSLPVSLQKARDDYLIARAKVLSAPRPISAAKGKTWAETNADLEASKDAAAGELRLTGVDSGEVVELFKRWAASEFKSADIRRDRVARLTRRMK